MLMDELTGLKLWTLEKPELYRVEVSLLEDGMVCDTVSARIGFRTAEFTPEGFLKRQTAQAARFKPASVFPTSDMQCLNGYSGKMQIF